MIIEVRVVCGWHCHRVYMMCASCECILLCTSHTLHTLYHYSWRQWRRQYRVTTRPILHTADIWTIDIPYRRSVDAWRRSSIPYAQLRINPSVRSSIQRRSIIGRSRRSSIDSSSGSDLLNVATFFANVSRSPFRVSLTDTHTDRIFPISRRFRVVGQTPLRSSFPINFVEQSFISLLL